MFLLDYLRFLKNEKPVWFWAFIIFFLLHAVVIYRQSQLTPWLNYGMYSQKAYPQASYGGISIEVNGQPFNYMQLNDANKEMLSCPIRLYAELKTDSLMYVAVYRQIIERYTGHADLINLSNKLQNSDESIAEFPAWLARYLEKSTNQPVDNYRVWEETYSYNEGKFFPNKSELLIDYDAQ